MVLAFTLSVFHVCVVVCVCGGGGGGGTFLSHSGLLPSSGSQFFIFNILKRYWLDANTASAGCQHK